MYVPMIGSIGLGTEAAGTAETIGFALGAGVGNGFGTTEGLDMSGDQIERKPHAELLLSSCTAWAHNHPRLTLKVESCACVLKTIERTEGVFAATSTHGLWDMRLMKKLEIDL